MTEHPAWPWVVFVANTAFIIMAVVSVLLLIAQQQTLVRELNSIDAKLVQAIKVNQTNIETVARKAGVPQRKIAYPELPIVPNVK